MTGKDVQAADVDIDARGLRCPEPLMVVRNRMMDMEKGQVIKVTATDPSTSWDFPKFCNFLNHELLHAETEGELYLYWIRKG
ncbi:MAG: sulfurtransferase TusA [Proteobacteria bacterium]|nr:sulfurtransferase TusA [Pseudomonadota bacterium]